MDPGAVYSGAISTSSACSASWSFSHDLSSPWSPCTGEMDGWPAMRGALFTPSNSTAYNDDAYITESPSKTAAAIETVTTSSAACVVSCDVESTVNNLADRLSGCDVRDAANCGSSCAAVLDDAAVYSSSSADWLAAALSAMSAGMTDSGVGTDHSSVSPLSVHSASPSASTGVAADAAWLPAASTIIDGCQMSRHSSDSGNGSAASRDTSLFGSPSCAASDDRTPSSPRCAPMIGNGASATAATAAGGGRDVLAGPAWTQYGGGIGVGRPVLAAAATASASPPSNNAVSHSSAAVIGGDCHLDATNTAHLSATCPNHQQSPFTMVCNTCQLPLCYTCALRHADHSLDTMASASAGLGRRSAGVAQQAAALAAALLDARRRSHVLANTLRQRCGRVQLEVAAACDKLRDSLANCQQRMELKALAICQMKLARLQQQDDELERVRARVLHVVSDQHQLTACGGGGGGGGGDSTERLLRCLLAERQMRSWASSVTLTPVEDAVLRYVPLMGGGGGAATDASRASVEAVTAAAGRVEATGSALKSSVLEPTRALLVGRPYHAFVQVRDHYGDECVCGGDSVLARVVLPDRRPVDCDVRHVPATCDGAAAAGVGGRYRLSFTPHLAGAHHFSVLVNGRVCGGLWTRRAVTPRRLSSLGPTPRLVIGDGEGCHPGQFCRPWGVAFSRGLGGGGERLAVSDRSNHRVQVFRAADGRLLFTLGQLGQRYGELNRPAGLAFTSSDSLVVADKDNHRVCVFSADGQFALAFGEKGSRSGMFNYPWDVACNAHDHIAVSDTRNHRIQLFSVDGQLLKKFSQEGADWKELDSPRGLAFHPDGRLFITDFNNHRLVVLDVHSGKMMFIGREGSQPARFLRPQGVACDAEGRLYVADCRNSRVQVLTSGGEFLAQLGEHGSRAGQFDQPQGVAVSPSGLLAVVCLDNHRVQLF